MDKRNETFYGRIIHEYGNAKPFHNCIIYYCIKDASLNLPKTSPQAPWGLFKSIGRGGLEIEALITGPPLYPPYPTYLI